MKSLLLTVCLSVLSLGIPAKLKAQAKQSGLIISNLKTSYASNPIGIDIEKPQFSWALTNNGAGRIQESYHLLVSDDAALLSREKGNIWDSGKVTSSRSVGILYEGMALLKQSEWADDWVGYPFGWIGRVLYFRHVFLKIILDVTIPGNSMAEVHVPVKNLKTLTVNGIPYRRSKAAKIISNNNEYAVFQVQAGDFRFVGI